MVSSLLFLSGSRTSNVGLLVIVVAVSEEEEDLMGPRVHTHSRLLLLCRVTGVVGHVSLSSSSSPSSSEDSRLSPVCGDRTCSDSRFDSSSSSRNDDAGVAPRSRLLPGVLDTPRRTICGGGRLREEMVDEDDSRSMWAIVYFSVWMSSVRGARKETFFEDGNMGRVVVKDLRLRCLGSGPFVRMDFEL